MVAFACRLIFFALKYSATLTLKVLMNSGSVFELNVIRCTLACVNSSIGETTKHIAFEVTSL